jgi:catechol 2,3-dioxygenase-like lactoylglutathione lyase family enzyme
VEMKLEVVLMPVSDIDASKTFYSEKLGFNIDHDTVISDSMRIVQLTPPGSGCSVVLAKGIPPADAMTPGAIQGVQLVVTDLDAAKEDFLSRGFDPGERVSMGPPEQDGSQFLFFSDPDGNGWAVQEWNGGN